MSGRPPADPLTGELPWRPLTRLSLALALIIGMAEISRLSGSILDNSGLAWSFDELTGPSALTARAGWLAEYRGGADVRRGLLLIYVAFDLAFIWLYWRGLDRYLKHRFTERPRKKRRAWLGVLAAVDLAADILAVGTLTLTDDPEWLRMLALVVASLNTIKWLPMLVVAVVIAHAALTGGSRTARSSLKTWYEILRLHRYSVAPLVFLAAVSIVPGANILDQVPDIERRWTDGPKNFFTEGIPALVGLALFTVALFLVGRMRSAVAARNWDGWLLGSAGGPPPPNLVPLVPWYRIFGAIFAGGLLLRLLGFPVGVVRLMVVCAIPILLAAYSGHLRRENKSRIAARERPLTRLKTSAPWSTAQLTTAMRAGDALSVALVVVGALAAVRAMVPVVVLGLTHSIDLKPYAVVVLVLAGVGVGLSWALASWVVRRLSTRASDHDPNRLAWLVPVPGEQRPVLLVHLPTGFLLTALALYIGLGMFPSTVARLGVLCGLDLALMALTGVVAGVSLILQRWVPAEAFQRLRLRSTPTLSLFLVLVVIANYFDAGLPIHQVRSIPAERPARPQQYRATLGATIDAWARDRMTADCARHVSIGGRSADVMPMLMVATEGGGIRAAEWTVEAVERIGREPCAKRATVLSSGVSGGAVGLAVLRFNEKPGAVTESMADSRALSYGLIGLLVRDFVYAATGIPLPALDHNTDGAWIDRAGLMEDAWNIAGRAPGTTTWQDVQFSGPTAGRADPRQPITGSLILNSMSVGNACRIWVSEMELIPEATGAPPRSSDEKLDCDQAFMPGVRSVDLISRYGAFGSAEHPGSGAAGCLYGLTASTAALLAARFPYVTPSGHVGECARQSGISPVDQLVDGGYLENTGLGTINDLADTWLDTVLAWNTEQLRQQHPHLLVPLVAYLDNDSGTDKSAAKRDISNEFLLPPLARLRAGSGAVADEANLQRSSDLVAPDRICPLGDSDCIQAVESIPGRIYDVYPASRPQISAPLGWVLSTVSREAIADALNQQERTPCYLDPATRSLRTVCARGYGSLMDLQAALRPAH